jgi:hypothetical protein
MLKLIFIVFIIMYPRTFIFILLIVLVAIGIFIKSRTEGLSLSQWPIGPTCRSCNFYTNKIGDMYYQEQNKVDQACDCGGFNVYRTKNSPGCYKQFLQGAPQVGQMQTCGCSENFNGASSECTCGPDCECGGNCGNNCMCGTERQSSCTSCNGEHCCMQLAGTFDPGTTFLRNLPCPVNFPLVTPDFEPVTHKVNVHVSELDIYKALEKGQLIVAANDGRVIDYTLKVLIENTKELLSGQSKGYPNFYSIYGPVIVFIRFGDNYYYMTGHPISYNPENYPNHVNHTNNWNVAKTIWNKARKELNQNAPVIFLSTSDETRFKLRAISDACPGMAESNTDYFFQPDPARAGCGKGGCLWAGKEVQ